jgi:hypothetical protein
MVAFMKDYLLYNLNNNQYDYFLLCLTYESILNYISTLENEQLLQSKKGKLLIDQLLITGNGKNRFMACEYNCGEIVLSTAENIIPDRSYKDLTIKLLQQNFEQLNNSILSDHQRELIMEGVTF